MAPPCRGSHRPRPLLLVNYSPEYQHGWGAKSYYTQLRLDPLPPASGGGIAISEATARLVEGYFQLKPFGAAPIKGVSEPVPLYEVLGVAPLSAPPKSLLTPSPASHYIRAMPHS